MDNILEILIPLVFAAIYFFGNMFGKSKDEDEASPGAPRRRLAEDEDSEAVERQRRIQEEIRRKIMERRQATSRGGSPEVAPSRMETLERRQEAEAEVRREVRKPQEVPEDQRERPYHFERDPKTKVFSWDESDDAYDGTMQAQLKRIEATRRQAERLKREAAKKRKTTESRPERRQRSGGYFSGTVRESLQDPQAARVAFIYGEVLGPPVSLRKESSVPGLN